MITKLSGNIIQLYLFFASLYRISRKKWSSRYFACNWPTAEVQLLTFLNLQEKVFIKTQVSLSYLPSPLSFSNKVVKRWLEPPSLDNNETKTENSGRTPWGVASCLHLNVCLGEPLLPARHQVRQDQAGNQPQVPTSLATEKQCNGVRIPWANVSYKVIQ